MLLADSSLYKQIKNPQPRGPQGFPGGTWSFDGDINMTPGGFKFRRGGSVNDLELSEVNSVSSNVFPSHIEIVDNNQSGGAVNDLELSSIFLVYI